MTFDKRETNVPRASGGDGAMFLDRAELLLSTAEATRASLSSGAGESAWREAIGRMLSGAATLRSATSANAMALLEEARRERDRITADRDVLRAEIEMLRGERDLYLALAVDAGAAVARNIVRWRQLGAASLDHPVQINATNGSIMEHHGESAEEASRTFAQSIDDPNFLAGTEITAGACDPVSQLTLTVSGYPAVGALIDLEHALSQLPSIRQCAVSSANRNTAQLNLLLRLPTAPLTIAAEILCLPGCQMAVVGVTTGHLAADYLVA
jgi:hypothetical protein